MNDFFLAASCREAGVTLITENVPDFDLIGRFLEHDHAPPWPEA